MAMPWVSACSEHPAHLSAVKSQNERSLDTGKPGSSGVNSKASRPGSTPDSAASGLFGQMTEFLSQFLQTESGEVGEVYLRCLHRTCVAQQVLPDASSAFTGKTSAAQPSFSLVLHTPQEGVPRQKG